MSCFIMLCLGIAIIVGIISGIIDTIRGNYIQ